MKITKKQLIRLIKESIQASQNPDNTIEGIFLRELYYQFNYLKGCFHKFDYFLELIRDAGRDWSEEIEEEILDKKWLLGQDVDPAFEQKIAILEETRKGWVDPGVDRINALRFRLDWILQDIIDIEHRLLVKGMNALDSEDSSFEFGESGIKDGEDELGLILKSNYDSNSKEEKINPIQYIIDTFNAINFIVGNIDSEAAAVLAQNNITGMNIYDKVDSLIMLLNDKGIIEDFELDTLYRRPLQSLKGQMDQVLPKLASLFNIGGAIEELISMLKNEKSEKFNIIMNAAINTSYPLYERKQ